MDAQRTALLDDTLGVHARVGHDAKGRSLVPPPTDSVYNYGERPRNDKGWKFCFLAIFVATTLFGFIALAVEAGAYTRSQLNLSAFYGMGGARWGCVTRVSMVLGGVQGV
jgi:hypothetical protein